MTSEKQKEGKRAVNYVVS